MSDTWRLFIAVELPSNILKVVEQIQTDLKRVIPHRAARWVRPEGMHLTLKFLGDVPASQIDDLKIALTESATGHSRFAIDIQGMGCFPNTQRPRVLWLGVGGDVQQLRRLRDDVEKYVAPLGYPTEKRRFNPHLTLARASRHASRDELVQLGKVAEEHDIGNLASWSVDAVSLMRSQLKPSGAIYTQIGHFTLET